MDNISITGSMFDDAVNIVQSRYQIRGLKLKMHILMALILITNR